jgi:SHS2 domain-containing protein
MKKSRPERGKPYRLIEHTADTGVRVTGGSLAELFENAAAGLREIMFGENCCVRRPESCSVKLNADDAEELLVSWLGYFIVKFELESFVSSGCKIIKISGTGLSADVSGERFNRAEHHALAEIKGVTYHGLKLRRTGALWTAEVIFDV